MYVRTYLAHSSGLFTRKYKKNFVKKITTFQEIDNNEQETASFFDSISVS